MMKSRRKKLAPSCGLVAALSVALFAASPAWSQGRGEVDRPAPPKAPLNIERLPPEFGRLPFVAQRGTRLVPRLPGQFFEVKREARKGIETDTLNMMPEDRDQREQPQDTSREVVPDWQWRLKDLNLKGEVAFEFFDLRSGRYFGYAANRAQLARLARTKSKLPDQSDPGTRISESDIRLEEKTQRSWSNSTDNRTRRAIADGWSDNNSIYQRLADYGGCSATVLAANNTRMIAITAAHCIFTAGNNFSTSKLRPRRNGGASPTWGSWSPYGFAYYEAYLNNDCEDNWNGGDCIKHDIALVFAEPDPGANVPANMGWAVRSHDFLDAHTKYRRGYPGCGLPHSPAGCTADNLYGDGALSVGGFSSPDSDGWNRRFKFSSDINPGDSGSGLYYYRDGFPYVFGVTSAEPGGCKTDCSSSRPNSGRRITPDFFDFISCVM
jgi:V8-like Glu-specific endopeptidase